MSRAILPKDFLWGFATASYQIEGSVDKGGRQDSIWDRFCRLPGKIADGSSGEVACDSYNRWAEDIELLKSLGARAYRFSIAWPRIIPLGGRNDPVNQEGIRFYVSFVDELRKAGIEPMVTLYHWDLPDALQQRYGGMMNKEEFVQDFANYAKVMFESMGSRVKYWITFNEPWCSAILGYSRGVMAPGRSGFRDRAAEGDSSTEPWIVGHNMLVAHAEAVKIYRKEYKKKFDGLIGITLNGDWAEPWDSEDPRDIEACERKLEFSIGWFADPVYFGAYPYSMRLQLGERLPEFTADESIALRGSNDFYGCNTYCSHYIRHRDGEPSLEDFAGNVDVLSTNKAGQSIGPETQSKWLWPHPPGFRKLLNWISKRYGDPEIYVTENGTSIKGENDLPLEEALNDEFRAEFYRNYVGALVDAYKDGVNVRSYMAWSLLDNFEWGDGYETRFGVTYVDYSNGQKRIPKKSAMEMRKIFGGYIKEA